MAPTVASIPFLSVTRDRGHALRSEVEPPDSLIVEIAKIESAVGPDDKSIRIVHLYVRESGNACADQCGDVRHRRRVEDSDEPEDCGDPVCLLHRPLLSGPPNSGVRQQPLLFHSSAGLTIMPLAHGN